MSVNNRTRNSKREKHVIQLEFDQLETPEILPKKFGRSVWLQDFNDEVQAEHEQWLASTSPEEFDALMEKVESLGIDLTFRYDRKRPASLTQSLQFR